MKSFADIVEEAKKCPPKKVAIAVAQDGEVIEAARECQENGIANAVLVGDADEIARISSERGIDISNFEVINEPEINNAARKAVQMVHSGEADMVMKGAVNSPTVLKAVLDKNIGLRTGKVLSHVAVFESPGYNRLMLMTDAGMNIKPTFVQKVDMVKNAVSVAKSLRIENPKVALISHMELVNPDMTSSVDAGMLCKMAERGQIKDCIVDGPLALDLALSKESARAKGVKSAVAGQADILLLDNIDAANVLYKALVFLGGAKITGLIVGASAPVILTSRADSSEAKLVSVAIGVLMANIK
ncbi:phosphate butyryltransferase [Pelotomaculum terephthalicicum JT]|uniref:phosphate butyryltransferase n=1 Tax=Pelotomaculum TaxID=191373 RepID=UPI0009C58374|nr:MULTISPECIES: phosphate butyryltransferase [Pelotomaculum]MCG9968015.1 phosphate butyryltransferase [Pelotomaculum terephthalicicum JT]OPX88866.1 MAG: Phosphate acetyltransferase [Pelotomaculum sp. PtaB.Bin117]OPY60808.1 MAG: Phosphate acetyltransferase [Pelotomaculum sp. PtaU1.Bin065]